MVETTLFNVAYTGSNDLLVRLDVYDGNDKANRSLPEPIAAAVSLGDLMQVAGGREHNLTIQFGPGFFLRYSVRLTCPDGTGGIGCRDRLITVPESNVRRLVRTSFEGHLRNPAVFPGAMKQAGLTNSLVRHQVISGLVGVAQTYNRVVLIPRLDTREVFNSCNVLRLNDVFSVFRHLKLDCEADDTDDWLVKTIFKNL